jgi:hypothetical protein
MVRRLWDCLSFALKAFWMRWRDGEIAYIGLKITIEKARVRVFVGKKVFYSGPSRILGNLEMERLIANGMKGVEMEINGMRIKRED